MLYLRSSSVLAAKLLAVTAMLSGAAPYAMTPTGNGPSADRQNIPKCIKQ
jgi:hypothetical protein